MTNTGIGFCFSNIVVISVLGRLRGHICTNLIKANMLSLADHMIS